MFQTLRFVDEKSDKFWRIESLGCEFMTNWGKTGTAGRYEIKEFDSEEDCEKQGLKLLASKKKKGYVDMPDFDANEHFYYDTEEYGIHPLTSHPIFRKYFSDDFYYDCSDEEAPFGSDEGNDSLHYLEEKFRKNSKMNFSDFPKLLIEKEWELTYILPRAGQSDEDLKSDVEKTYHGLSGDQEVLQTDQVILATVFGQIKITGKLDATLKDTAFLSLERMERMYRMIWDWKEVEPPYNIRIMRRDLTKFVNERF